MAVRTIQTSFTLGELDPRLEARVDFNGYYKGAKRLRNTVCLPQGAAKRRFGTIFTDDVQDRTAGGTTYIANADQVKMLVYDYDLATRYVLVLRKDTTNTVAIDVYFNEALQASISTGGVWTLAQLENVRWVKAQDRIIFLHEAVAPQEFFRTAAHAGWTFQAFPVVNYPVTDFSIIDNTNYMTAAGTFTPSAVSGAAVTITAAGGITPFTNAMIGGIFRGNGGILRITGFTSTTVVTGYTIQPFAAAAAIRADRSFLSEPAWSAARGFPSRGTFFQRRLVLANSQSQPNTLWASKTNDFRNFDDSEALDDNGFNITIGQTGNDEIQSVIGGKALTALTYNAVFASSLYQDTAMTPANAALSLQDGTEGSANFEAVKADNRVYYVDVSEERIQALDYDLDKTSFKSVNASLLSPQLISDPKSIAAYRPNTDDGIFLLVVNSDGTLAVFQTLEEQNVAAWTLATTRGNYKKIATTKDECWALIERDVTNATADQACDVVYNANSTFDVFVDITAEASDAANDAAILQADNEYLVFGHEMPFNKITVTLNTDASVDVAQTFEYLNGNGVWVTIPDADVMDGTVGFTGGGDIDWTLADDTPDWEPQTLNGVEDKYWFRMRRTTDTVAIVPIEDKMLINVDSRLYIEKLSFDKYTDSTVDTTSDANGLVTGLDHLIGQRVWARVEGAPEGLFYVDSSGEITVSKESSDVDVGLDYTPLITPMPLAVPFPTQPNLIDIYRPKLVKSFFVDYYESLAVIVNGQEIPEIALDLYVLGEVLSPVSGFFEHVPRGGWDPRQEISITQKSPSPMTIRGIGFVVEVN